MRRLLVTMAVVLAFSCTEKQANESGTDTAATTINTETATATVATTTPIKPPELNRGWIAILSRQGGAPAFFARILISGAEMMIRDSAGHGFPPAIPVSAERV